MLCCHWRLTSLESIIDVWWILILDINALNLNVSGSLLDDLKGRLFSNSVRKHNLSRELKRFSYLIGVTKENRPHPNL